MDSFSSAGDLLRSILPTPAGPVAPEGEIASGWSRLDEATGGWRPGELVLIEGGAGTGKSALAYALALHAARRDRAVALVPLKHPPATAVQRLVCAMSGVPLARLRRGASVGDEWSAILSEAHALSRLPLLVHTAADPTLERLLEELPQLVVSRGIRLLVIDGLASIRIGALDSAGASADVRATVAAAALSTLLARLQVVGIATSGAGTRVGGDPQAHRRLRIRTDGSGEVAAVEVVSGAREPVTLPARFDLERLHWQIG